jgi:multidrug efflux pump
MGVTISNMVMFGLILAVGMLVDGAIVVVEYADKRIAEGTGPMSAYVEAAKRMFWPVVSSTATTLCAFLPMLFWPGVPGQFMGMLPVTLIFVLSASLIVALIFLPILGGVSGRLSRAFEVVSKLLRKKLPWIIRAALVPVTLFCLFGTTMQLINPSFFIKFRYRSIRYYRLLTRWTWFGFVRVSCFNNHGGCRIQTRTKKGYFWVQKNFIWTLYKTDRW